MSQTHLNELLLLTKGDIPFTGGKVVVRQPPLREIALIGGDEIFNAILFLTIDPKEIASEIPEGMTAFDIIVQLLSSEESADMKEGIVNLFQLLFPDYRLTFTPRSFVLQHIKDAKQVCVIDKENYPELVEILKTMFCLDLLFGQEEVREYDPANAYAAALAKRFKAYHKKLSEMKNKENNNGQKPTILSQYFSILSVGEKKDMNTLSEYSVYQLVEEYNRFSLKEEFDMIMRLQCAGATDLPTPEDWRKPLHTKEEE